MKTCFIVYAVIDNDCSSALHAFGTRNSAEKWIENVSKPRENEDTSYAELLGITSFRIEEIPINEE